MAAPGLALSRNKSFGSSLDRLMDGPAGKAARRLRSGQLGATPRAAVALARAKARRVLLGDESRSLRAALLEELEQPMRVQLKDKVLFTAGVVNLVVSEAVLLTAPHLFRWWYTAWILPLLALRYVSYTRRKYM
jgi:hypothetical protein